MYTDNLDFNVVADIATSTINKDITDVWAIGCRVRAQSDELFTITLLECSNPELAEDYAEELAKFVGDDVAMKQLVHQNKTKHMIYY